MGSGGYGIVLERGSVRGIAGNATRTHEYDLYCGESIGIVSGRQRRDNEGAWSMMAVKISN